MEGEQHSWYILNCSNLTILAHIRSKTLCTAD
jgi:hypothetical protein